MECGHNVSSILSLLTIETAQIGFLCLSMLSSMRFQLLKFGFTEPKQDYIAAMISLFRICRGYLAFGQSFPIPQIFLDVRCRK